MLDPSLSPRARNVLAINAAAAYASLVPTKAGSIEARDALELLKPADIVAVPASDREAASAALSGLWLWHDFLHESHEISQKIETPTGSFWHAIMHRREGDFSNAKYWFRRCPGHPALPAIAARVDTLIQQLPADKSIFRLTASSTWNAAAFVDLVETVHRDPNDERCATVIELQRLEWRTLFESTLREAQA